MKRFLTVLSSLLLIFALFSCGNLNAGKSESPKGSLTFSLARNADPNPLGYNPLEGITKIEVILYQLSDSGERFFYDSVSRTKDDIEEDVVFKNLEPAKYLVNCNGYKDKLLSFTGESDVADLTDGKDKAVEINMNLIQFVLTSGEY